MAQAGSLALIVEFFALLAKRLVAGSFTAILGLNVVSGVAIGIVVMYGLLD